MFFRLRLTVPEGCERKGPEGPVNFIIFLRIKEKDDYDRSPEESLRAGNPESPF
jgi:hypothetical protein